MPSVLDEYRGAAGMPSRLMSDFSLPDTTGITAPASPEAIRASKAAVSMRRRMARVPRSLHSESVQGVLSTMDRSLNRFLEGQEGEPPERGGFRLPGSVDVSGERPSVDDFRHSMRTLQDAIIMAEQGIPMRGDLPLGERTGVIFEELYQSAKGAWNLELMGLSGYDPERAEAVRDAARAMGRLPPDMELEAAQGAWDTFNAAIADFDNFAALSIHALATSAPSIAAGFGVGLAAGPLAGMLGAGTVGMATEAFLNEWEVLEREGIDPTDTEQVRNAYSNPDIRRRIVAKSTAKAAAIGLVDALSWGLAGKVLSPLERAAFETTRGRVLGEAGNLLAQTVAQGASEGSGEALGQLVAFGDVHSKDVVVEALGGAGIAIPTVAAARGFRAARAAGGVREAMAEEAAGRKEARDDMKKLRRLSSVFQEAGRSAGRADAAQEIFDAMKPLIEEHGMESAWEFARATAAEQGDTKYWIAADALKGVDEETLAILSEVAPGLTATGALLTVQSGAPFHLEVADVAVSQPLTEFITRNREHVKAGEEEMSQFEAASVAEAEAARAEAEAEAGTIDDTAGWVEEEIYSALSTVKSKVEARLTARLLASMYSGMGRLFTASGSTLSARQVYERHFGGFELSGDLTKHSLVIRRVKATAKRLLEREALEEGLRAGGKAKDLAEIESRLGELDRTGDFGRGEAEHLLAGLRAHGEAAPETVDGLNNDKVEYLVELGGVMEAVEHARRVKAMGEAAEEVKNPDAGSVIREGSTRTLRGRVGEITQFAEQEGIDLETADAGELAAEWLSRLWRPGPPPGELLTDRKVRGFLDPLTKSIHLLRNSDPSTVLHEHAHLFLEMMRFMDHDGAMDPEMRRALFDFLDVDGWTEIGNEKHEWFAEAFELYLHEGRAPNSSMRRLFAGLARLMAIAYQALGGRRAIKTEIPTLTLDENILRLFDRLVFAHMAADREVRMTPPQEALAMGRDPAEVRAMEERANEAAFDAKLHGGESLDDRVVAAEDELGALERADGERPEGLDRFRQPKTAAEALSGGGWGLMNPVKPLGEDGLPLRHPDGWAAHRLNFKRADAALRLLRERFGEDSVMSVVARDYETTQGFRFLVTGDESDIAASAKEFGLSYMDRRGLVREDGAIVRRAGGEPLLGAKARERGGTYYTTDNGIVFLLPLAEEEEDVQPIAPDLLGQSVRPEPFIPEPPEPEEGEEGTVQILPDGVEDIKDILEDPKRAKAIRRHFDRTAQKEWHERFASNREKGLKEIQAAWGLLVPGPKENAIAAEEAYIKTTRQIGPRPAHVPAAKVRGRPSLARDVDAAVEWMAGNLSNWFRLMPEEARKQAAMTYYGYNALARELSDESGVPFLNAAGVISALSPRMTWENTIAYARQAGRLWKRGLRGEPLAKIMMDTPPPSFFRYLPDGRLFGGVSVGGKKQIMRNVKKAVLVLEAPPEKVWELFTEPKTRNFFGNIADPTSSDYITVDTHVVTMASLRTWMPGQTYYRQTFTRNLYPVYAEAVRRAAEREGVSPSEMQSVVWEMGRLYMSPEAKRQPRFETGLAAALKDEADGNGVLKIAPLIQQFWGNGRDHVLTPWWFDDGTTGTGKTSRMTRARMERTSRTRLPFREVFGQSSPKGWTLTRGELKALKGYEAPTPDDLKAGIGVGPAGLARPWMNGGGAAFETPHMGGGTSFRSPGLWLTRKAGEALNYAFVSVGPKAVMDLSTRMTTKQMGTLEKYIGDPDAPHTGLADAGFSNPPGEGPPFPNVVMGVVRLEEDRIARVGGFPMRKTTPEEISSFNEKSGTPSEAVRKFVASFYADTGLKPGHEAGEDVWGEWLTSRAPNGELQPQDAFVGWAFEQGYDAVHFGETDWVVLRRGSDFKSAYHRRAAPDPSNANIYLQQDADPTKEQLGELDEFQRTAPEAVHVPLDPKAWEEASVRSSVWHNGGPRVFRELETGKGEFYGSPGFWMTRDPGEALNYALIMTGDFLGGGEYGGTLSPEEEDSFRELYERATSFLREHTPRPTLRALLDSEFTGPEMTSEAGKFTPNVLSGVAGNISNLLVVDDWVSRGPDDPEETVKALPQELRDEVAMYQERYGQGDILEAMDLVFREYTPHGESRPEDAVVAWAFKRGHDAVLFDWEAGLGKSPWLVIQKPNQFKSIQFRDKRLDPESRDIYGQSYKADPPRRALADLFKTYSGLAEAMEEGGWGILTAHVEGMSQEDSYEANAEMAAHLESEFGKENVIRAFGRKLGENPVTGFLVVGSELEIARTAARYNQRDILTRHGIVRVDSKVEFPRKRGEPLIIGEEAEKQDFFTEVHVEGGEPLKFSMVLGDRIDDPAEDVYGLPADVIARIRIAGARNESGLAKFMEGSSRHMFEDEDIKKAPRQWFRGMPPLKTTFGREDPSRTHAGQGETWLSSSFGIALGFIGEIEILNRLDAEDFLDIPSSLGTPSGQRKTTSEEVAHLMQIRSGNHADNMGVYTVHVNVREDRLAVFDAGQQPWHSLDASQGDEMRIPGMTEEEARAVVTEINDEYGQLTTNTLARGIKTVPSMAGVDIDALLILDVLEGDNSEESDTLVLFDTRRAKLPAARSFDTTKDNIYLQSAKDFMKGADRMFFEDKGMETPKEWYRGTFEGIRTFYTDDERDKSIAWLTDRRETARMFANEVMGFQHKDADMENEIAVGGDYAQYGTYRGIISLAPGEFLHIDLEGASWRDVRWWKVKDRIFDKVKGGVGEEFGKALVKELEIAEGRGEGFLSHAAPLLLAAIKENGVDSLRTSVDIMSMVARAMGYKGVYYSNLVEDGTDSALEDNVALFDHGRFKLPIAREFDQNSPDIYLQEGKVKTFHRPNWSRDGTTEPVPDRDRKLIEKAAGTDATFRYDVQMSERMGRPTTSIRHTNVKGNGKPSSKPTVKGKYISRRGKGVPSFRAIFRGEVFDRTVQKDTVEKGVRKVHAVLRGELLPHTGVPEIPVMEKGGWKRLSYHAFGAEDGRPLGFYFVDDIPGDYWPSLLAAIRARAPVSDDVAELMSRSNERLKRYHGHELIGTGSGYWISKTRPMSSILAQAAARKPWGVAVLRRAAKRSVSLSTVGDILKGLPKVRGMERKFASESMAAVRGMDTGKAYAKKRAHYLQLLTLREAARAKNRLGIHKRAYRRWTRLTRRRQARVGKDWVSPIRAVLADYGLQKEEPQAGGMEAAMMFFNSKIEAGVPLDLSLLPPSRQWAELSYRQAVDLYDFIRQASFHAGRESKEAREEFMRKVGRIISGIKAPKRMDRERLSHAAGAMRDFKDQAYGFLRRPEHIVVDLDGQELLGPLWNELMLPVEKALDNELVMMKEAADGLGDILRSIPGAGRAWSTRKVYRNLTRENLFVIGLNSGNTGNREALLNGSRQHLGWDDGSLDKALRQLTAEEWKVIEAIWKWIDRYWAPTAALEKRTKGVVPRKVEAEPFAIATSDGRAITVGGGYFPIIFDHNLSHGSATDSIEERAKQMLAGAPASAATRQGRTIERVGSFGSGKRVTLKIDGLMEHVRDSIHDLTHREALLEVAKVLNHRDFRTAVHDRLGLPALGYMDDWVRSVASNGYHRSDALQRLIARLRQGISVTYLGLSVKSGLSQFLGMGAVASHLGTKWALYGLFSLFSGRGAPVWSRIKWIREQSPQFASRTSTFDRDVHDAFALARGDRISKAVQTVVWAHIIAMDGFISGAGFMGAYGKAMHEGRSHEEAIRLGDQAVRATQGSALVKDMAAVMNMNEYGRLLTMFGTPFSAILNKTMDIHRGRLHGGTLYTYAAGMTALIAVPAILHQALFDEWPDEDEDPGFGAYAWHFGSGLIAEGTFGLPVVREFTGLMTRPSGAAANIPLSGAITTIYNMGPSSWNLIAGEGTHRDLQPLIVGSGFITRLPTNQVWRIVDAHALWEEGELELGGAFMRAAGLRGLQQ